jgi:hypothetical protein
VPRNRRAAPIAGRNSNRLRPRPPKFSRAACRQAAYLARKANRPHPATLSAAAAADAEEDKLYGGDKTGEEMPEWVADKQRRAERIRKAKAELKAELESEAKAAAEAKLKAAAEAEETREAEGRRKRGAKAAPPCVEPEKLRRTSPIRRAGS